MYARGPGGWPSILNTLNGLTLHQMFDKVLNSSMLDSINPFFPMFPFDLPENIINLWFYDVFRGIKREHWGKNG